MIFFDTETCGFHGPIVLLQYAKGLTGETRLVSVWKHTVRELLEIFDEIINDPDGVVGFNLAFDWFHLCQTYTTIMRLKDWDVPLQEMITEYALAESEARFGPCIKPTSALDLMLHARKGPYQSTMDREDVRIKRVPTALAYQLADKLEELIPLKDIYFMKKKDKSRKWVVYDLESSDQEGRIDPNFKDVCLKFAPSSALKALAVDALNIPPEEVLWFGDVSVGTYPEEVGYAPFALALGSPEDWKGTWPECIYLHISHWTHHEIARKYATLDVVYLQKLYTLFGSPSLGDDDSILACMVGAVRWKGFSINLKGLQALKEKTEVNNVKIIDSTDPFLKQVPGMPGKRFFEIPTYHVTARRYIEAVLDPAVALVNDGSTKKTNLETMAKWMECPICKVFFPNGGTTCGTCLCNLDRIPAAVRAEEVLRARQANYEVNFYKKLLLAGRFHASVKVIGALSGRMSGADDLNPQGIKRTKEVREKFTFVDNGFTFCGGDFSAFEVCLAEACYNDPDLRADLQSKRECHRCDGKGIVKEHDCKKEECHYCDGHGACNNCKGKGVESTKIHALFGQYLYPHLTYKEILLSAGQPIDYYERSKRSFFATLYGGEAETLNNRVGIPIEDANRGLHMFAQKYKKVGELQAKINDMFCSMRQPDREGHGKVEWHEPADYIESMLGFRRYFTLENKICKALYTLAQDPPKNWCDVKIKVQRRDRLQLAVNAVRSALFAAAFALQAGNMRAAKNHVIQSTGAQITKAVQRKIWDVQPAGVNNWLVQPLNVHDEIQCPTHPSVVEKVKEVVRLSVESFRERVPLIKMDWATNLNTWADKS